MAAVIVALGYCIYTTTMDKRQKKKEQQAYLQENMRSGSEKNPSVQRSRGTKGETLREKASRKLHGKDANPSMLGDPISIKAESSTHVPTDDAAGSQTTTLRGSESSERSMDGGGEQGRTNPTMLGDPTSITAETEERSSGQERDMEEASRSSRGSKL